MDNAELLTEVDTSHLGAIEREFGRDLTNGEVEQGAREIGCFGNVYSRGEPRSTREK